MVFSSLTFLYLFLPAAMLLCLLLPDRAKNAALLLCSLVFYAFGEPVYLLLLLCTGMLTWLAGLRMAARPARAGRVLFLTVGLQLLLLGVFKYADLLVGRLNALTGLALPLPRLPLPLGISFYTFQTVSYLIDVRRGVHPPERSCVDLLAYICMFPQLIAGPIVRYDEVAAALHRRRSGWNSLSAGAERFACGLAKKALLANMLGELCAAFRASPAPSVAFHWLYALAFTLQLYFDFSGYSDMAVGLGRMLGFSFPENFDHPFCSASITEFWRRWHMTLGRFFRDYVYIPLGGNRRHAVRNVLIVWLLTGLWHGAAWSFALWGLYYGLLLLAEKRFLGAWLRRRSAPLRHIYVIVLTLIGCALFGGADTLSALRDVGGMFGLDGLPLWSAQTGYFLRSFAPTLLIAALGATPLPRRLLARLRARLPRLGRVCAPALTAAALLFCTAALVGGSLNPFLYFRF